MRRFGPFLPHLYGRGIHDPPGIDLPAWLTAIGTLVIAVGLVFAGLQVRESRRTRHADVIAEIARRWDGREITQSRRLTRNYATVFNLRDAFIAARDANSPDYYAFERELSFFEDIGALVRLGGVSLSWIQEMLGVVIITRWEMWQATVIAVREQAGSDDAYKNFDLLAALMRGERMTRGWRLRRWLISQLS